MGTPVEMVEKLESTASSASTTGSYSLESISLSGNMTGNRPGKESHNTLTQSHPGMAIDYVCHGTTGPKTNCLKGYGLFLRSDNLYIRL